MLFLFGISSIAGALLDIFGPTVSSKYFPPLVDCYSKLTLGPLIDISLDRICRDSFQRYDDFALH